MAAPQNNSTPQVLGAGASIQVLAGGRPVIYHFPIEGGTLALDDGRVFTFTPNASQMSALDDHPITLVPLVDEDPARAYGVYEEKFPPRSESSASIMTVVEGDRASEHENVTQTPSSTASDSSEDPVRPRGRRQRGVPPVPGAGPGTNAGGVKPSPVPSDDNDDDEEEDPVVIPGQRRYAQHCASKSDSQASTAAVPNRGVSSLIDYSLLYPYYENSYPGSRSADSEMSEADESASVSAVSSNKTVVPDPYEHGANYDAELAMMGGNAINDPSESESVAPSIITRDPAEDSTADSESIDLDNDLDMDAPVNTTNPQDPPSYPIKWTSQQLIDARLSSIPNRNPTQKFVPCAPVDIKNIPGHPGFKRHWGARLPSTPAKDKFPVLLPQPQNGLELSDEDLKKQAMRRVRRLNPQTLGEYVRMREVIWAEEVSVRSSIGRDGSTETEEEGKYEHEDAELRSYHGEHWA